MISNLAVIALLTLFTQTGGIIWLVCLPVFFLINKKIKGKFKRRSFKLLFFSALYLSAVFFWIPPLARWQCGRVPLPVYNNTKVKPHNIFFYCLLNRHYVRPELKKLVEETADIMVEKFPGTVMVYLDANFPFFNGYPLQPHISHRDGKKLDIAFYWKNTHTGNNIEGTPSWYGYGASALPLPGEMNMQPLCRKKGNWYRNLLRYLALPFFNSEKYILDTKATRELIRLLATDPRTGKILLEPHLKTRLRLDQYGNIRFQGCRAARHDDHLHLEIK